MREFLEGISAAGGWEFTEDAQAEDIVNRLGGLGRIIGATIRDTADVTVVSAGYKSSTPSASEYGSSTSSCAPPASPETSYPGTASGTGRLPAE